MRSPIADALAALATTLDGLGVRWYLFGAQAALLHGAVRLTADIDATIALASVELRTLVAALGAAGFTPGVVDVDAFVARTRVLPTIHQQSGIAVDLVLAGAGIEELFLARAQLHLVEGVTVPVATAEDVIVMKIIAGRPKDIDDVIAILGAHPADLDLRLVRDMLRQIEQALARSDLVVELERSLQLARE